MQRRSKLSKSRSWVHPPDHAENHPAHEINNRRDARASMPLSGRKSGFFSQLFSSSSSPSLAPPTAGPTFVNLSRKSPSPSPSPSIPSATVPHSIPPNLSIRSLSPDLLNDPAFSTDPLSHPLFVTNPDSPGEALTPSKPFSNSSSHADMTESPTSRSLASSYIASRSSFLSPTSNSEMGANSSRTDISSSYTTTTSSSNSRESTDKAGKLPQKNLIILEPPRMQSPPPAYDDPGHSRPVTSRHTSVPVLPASNLERIDVPPRPATVANDDSRNRPRRSRGLDPIDELDETNPLGHSLHHGGPYEAIKLSQNPRHQHPQVNHNSRRDQQPVAQGPSHKTTNRQPYTTDPTAFIPLGAPLNITPGQILPRNYLPYTQPQPPQQQSQTRPIQQQPPRSPQLRPQSSLHRQQQQRNPAQTPPQVQAQMPSYAQPPSPRLLQPQQQIFTSTSFFDPAYYSPPSPSIYDDDEDPYGGIEGDEEDEEHDPLNSEPALGISLESRFASLEVPRDPHSVPVNGFRGESSMDDPVARALYAVERARITRTQTQTQRPPNPNPKPFNGFAAFDEGPSSSSGYQLPQSAPHSRQASSSSLPLSALPPGAYQPPPRTYEMPPEQHTRGPIAVSHYPPVTPAAENHLDAAWHRRATSLDVDAYGAPRNPGAQNLPQVHGNTRYNPNSNLNTSIPHQGISNKIPSQPQYPSPTADLRDHQHQPQQQQQRQQQQQQQQRFNTPAPSIQSSLNARNGPLPLHIPSKLTMPEPLYNPSGAPPPVNRNALPSQQQHRQPLRSTSLFHPPQHGNGINGMTRPSPSMAQNQNYPPRQQQCDNSAPSPAPGPTRVQAQVIPIAGDSRKVLRKRSTVHGNGDAGAGMATGLQRTQQQSSPVPMVAPNMPDWLAAAPSNGHQPPSRSKSEIRPPMTGGGRIASPPSMPMTQVNGKKVPKRLSKKR